jgi:23S rRNA (guanine745-N1)-methyltransferase
MGRRDIVEKIMTCPVCRAEISVTCDGRSAFCLGARRHCFDFAKEGYLSIPGNSGSDSKEAVRARTGFLSRGYYDEAARFVCRTVEQYIPDSSVIIDAGCGEGYYTEQLANASQMTLGVDLSKFAVLAASKRAGQRGIDNVLYATASVFSLPVKDACADAVVNIFAPCAEDEYARVLKDGGYLFVVGAGKDHLMGLKRVLYDDVYENGERADLPEKMQFVGRVSKKYMADINGEGDIAALFSMTPYYWRTAPSDKDKLLMLDTLKTEIEFEINIYKK